jgi:hypothetical protein
VTRKSSDNWLVATVYVGVPGNDELIAIPILPNGNADLGRDPVQITNFGFTTPSGLAPLNLPWISNQGDAVTFVLADTSGVPDIFNVYMFENLAAILAAAPIPSTNISSLAPNDLGDLVDIRASDTVNPVSTPAFSQDGSLVFFCEDFNNVFDFENFFASAAAGQWDIGLAQRDGTGDVIFTATDNQSILTPFPTGNRLAYGRAVSGPVDYHIFITTLIAENDIDAESDPLPDGGTTAVINGNSEPLPFVLTDSAVQATTDVTVGDASGTVIELPTDQVINFPDGSGATGITIFTPIDPVTEVSLPNPQTAIPVLREFGPDGTQFYPPIAITITYTDAEVASISDESQMIPYLYDSGTQTFEPLCDEGDTACLAGITVDTVNNTLTFQTDHFSTYGLGGPKAAAPQRPWAILVTTIALAAMTLIALGVRMRGRKS